MDKLPVGIGLYAQDLAKDAARAGIRILSLSTYCGEPSYASCTCEDGSFAIFWYDEGEWVLHEGGGANE